MRQVPLRASAFVSGEPAEGYELTGIELAEETVPVAARQEVLDALTELTTDSPLDITGANGRRQRLCPPAPSDGR